jgi:nucleoside 2-deoxyribosyltransferase
MQATSDTRPKKFVFTLMPFSEAFNDIYKLGIKAACESAGAYCERIDEQIFNENILLRLYNQINKADLIVSDMTGRNPNVFYETGYAHALNKKVILLTQAADDIPFDLKHYPHIVYSGKIVVLKDELQRHVQWYLSQPDRVVADRTSVLRYYLQNQLIENYTRGLCRMFR